MRTLIERVELVTTATGKSVAWLATFLVVVQFAAVFLNAVFGYSLIFIQDTVIYMHALLFLLGAAFTLMRDGHVRIDIFYRESSPRFRAAVDLLGVLFLLLPVCGAILWHALPYAANSWAMLEGAQEGTGLHLPFLLKSCIPVFSLLLMLQGAAIAVRNLHVLTGWPREPNRPSM